MKADVIKDKATIGKNKSFVCMHRFSSVVDYSNPVYADIMVFVGYSVTERVVIADSIYHRKNAVQLILFTTTPYQLLLFEDNTQ